MEGNGQNRSVQASAGVRPTRRVSSWCLLAAGAYALLIAYGSLVPLEYRHLEWNEAVRRFAEIKNLQIGTAGRADWLANLFLYVPIGLLTTVGWGLSVRHAFGRIALAFVTLAGCIALAFAIEFTQLWFPPRTVSQNDLRAEAIGSFAGVVLGLACLSLRSRYRGMHVGTNLSYANVWGWAYLGLLFGYSLLPADIVVSYDELQAKFDQQSITWIPFTDIDLRPTPVLKRLLHVASFVPLGWFLAWRRIRSGGSARYTTLDVGLRCCLIGGVVGLAIEIAQLPLISRSSSTTAVLLAALGSSLGGILHAITVRPAPPRFVRWMQRMVSNRLFWVTATILYAILIPAVLLAPFQVIQDQDLIGARWDALFSVPFATLYNSREFDALENVLEKGAVFIILGASSGLAIGEVESRRERIIATVVCVIATLLLGLSIEVAQVVIDAHLPDLTDVLIYATFAGTGCYASLRWSSIRSRSITTWNHSWTA